VLKKKVKAQLGNGKLVKAPVAESRKRVKDSVGKTKTIKRAVKTAVIKASTPKNATKSASSLGKRKRSDLSAKAKSSHLTKKVIPRERKIAKPRSKVFKPFETNLPAKSPARSIATPSPARPLYETVSHRSRKSKSH
jgi:hypothetical protein